MFGLSKKQKLEDIKIVNINTDNIAEVTRDLFLIENKNNDQNKTKGWRIMQINAQPVRGTKDFLPHEMQVRDAVQKIIVDMYKSFGF